MFFLIWWYFFPQDETDSIAETEADRDMKRERDHDGDREAAGAINLTSRWIKIMMMVAITVKAHKTNNRIKS